MVDFIITYKKVKYQSWWLTTTANNKYSSMRGGGYAILWVFVGEKGGNTP